MNALSKPACAAGERGYPRSPRMRALAALLAIGVVGCNGSPVSTESSAGSPSSSAATLAPAASATAPLLPAPDYDLAADIRLRTAFARLHLGSRAEVDIEDGVFLLVAEPYGIVMKPSVELVKPALAALYDGRFTKHPARAVTVYVVGKDADYEDLCRQRFGHECGSPFGEYVKETREVIANQGFGAPTVLHEITHVLLDENFPAAPRWLREGIAALYELPDVEGGEIHGKTNWRLPYLRKALDSASDRDLARLDALFRMPDDLFDGDRALVAYAVARFFCQWLDSPGENHLWEFFHRWRDHVTDDPTGEKSFTAVVGKTPGEANAAWENWVRSL